MKDDDTLSVLLVSAAGQEYAIPILQIERISPVEKPDSPSAASWKPLSAVLSESDFGDKDAGMAEKYILWGQDGKGWGVEKVGDIITLELLMLRRLPSLLAAHTHRAIWAAVIWQEEPVVLVDLEKL